jgi:hypothetical protein
LDLSGDLNNPFAAHINSIVNHTLHYSRIVTDIKERKMFTMLTTTGHPAAHRNRRANIGCTQIGA